MKNGGDFKFIMPTILINISNIWVYYIDDIKLAIAWKPLDKQNTPSVKLDSFVRET